VIEVSQLLRFGHKVPLLCYITHPYRGLGACPQEKFDCEYNNEFITSTEYCSDCWISVTVLLKHLDLLLIM